MCKIYRQHWRMLLLLFCLVFGGEVRFCLNHQYHHHHHHHRDFHRHLYDQGKQGNIHWCKWGGHFSHRGVPGDCHRLHHFHLHNCYHRDENYGRAGQRICRLLAPLSWFSPIARWSPTKLIIIIKGGPPPVHSYEHHHHHLHLHHHHHHQPQGWSTTGAQLWARHTGYDWRHYLVLQVIINQH